MRKMRILITGAAGMLGSTLVPVLEKEGHQVYPTDISPDNSKVNFLDVCETSLVFKELEKVKPDLVIHLAAETDVDKCEIEPVHAYRVNTLGTQNVALACKENKAVLVYLSTAGVFDGNKTEAYSEFDQPNPINIYGKAKWEGEKFVEKLVQRYFIIRASWMIGGGEKDKKFVAKIIHQLEQETRKLKVVTDKIGSPTYTFDLSRCIAKLILTNYYGLYHIACKGKASRYEVAQKILEILGQDDVAIQPITSDQFPLPAPRPDWEVLSNFVLDLRGMNTMRSWEEALAEYLQESFSQYIRSKRGVTVGI